MNRSGHATVEQAVLRRVAGELRPELLARIPDQLVFRRLEPSVQRGIAKLHLDREVARLACSGHQLTIADGVMEYLLRQGFHPQLGARPLRQTIERNLRDAVVRALFKNGTSSGRITVDYSGSHLALI
jgi:ATP-dependent Clp protease ATP-binding subunit ClpA